jgi:hypothetical protein
MRSLARRALMPRKIDTIPNHFWDFMEDGNFDKFAQKEREAPHVHQWSRWQEIGRTGDWFHPLIVERTCVTCGAIETDEH